MYTNISDKLITQSTKSNSGEGAFYNDGPVNRNDEVIVSTMEHVQLYIRIEKINDSRISGIIFRSNSEKNLALPEQIFIGQGVSLDDEKIHTILRRSSDT